MRTLLTFTGFQDPYAKGPLAENEQAGPILSLLSARPFEKVVLLSTPNTTQHSKDTKEAIQQRYPQIGTELIEVPLVDPTDYAVITKGVRDAFRSMPKSGEREEYFVSVASGTPQMHAVWILLIASGEIPARVLHVRPPRFVSRERPLVSEIDLTSSTFPTVRWEATQPAPDYAPSKELTDESRTLGIVGDHPSLLKALDTAAALAASDAPVLIAGETGTGKELFARLIHRLSGRPAERFVPLNCAALPRDLAESVLFGHKRGAFTGAVNDQLGKFDLADGGSLFLDELGELPLESQGKLLRILEDGVLEPLGAKKGHRVNVRVIAATNSDLSRAIKQKKFREDLYYRLSVGQIRLPPLRERAGDIPKTALAILDRINAALRHPKKLTPGALVKLQGLPWPGNVRDLENALERSALLAKKEVLDADDVVLAEPPGEDQVNANLPEPQPGFSIEDYLKDARRKLVARALELADGNRSKAARLLGITPQALHKFVGKVRRT
ncbi:MAG: sigma-54-dependent Fis family transcriptional regulator [Betaproteobacteria bacterium]|nr:MAG: sigma-54-dependent Fis family transcriptional regulator [Betaproteobacteria bacterium]